MNKEREESLLELYKEFNRLIKEHSLTTVLLAATFFMKTIFQEIEKVESELNIKVEVEDET